MSRGGTRAPLHQPVLRVTARTVLCSPLCKTKGWHHRSSGHVTQNWKNWDLNPSLLDSSNCNLNPDPEDLGGGPWAPCWWSPGKGERHGEGCGMPTSGTPPPCPLPQLWAPLRRPQLRGGPGPTAHLSKSSRDEALQPRASPSSLRS